jgi:Na+-transporting NADH:ubiquinone oxidoreductase subunit NqrD
MRRGAAKGTSKELKRTNERPKVLFMGVVLLTIAVLSWSRLFGWSLVIPGAVFIVGMVFWFAITLCQKSRLNRKAT